MHEFLLTLPKRHVSQSFNKSWLRMQDSSQSLMSVDIDTPSTAAKTVCKEKCDLAHTLILGCY